MSLLPPPRPPRRPISIASALLDYSPPHTDQARGANRPKSPSPPILVNVGSPKMGEALAIGIVLETGSETVSDDEDESVSTTPTASPTLRIQALQQQSLTHTPAHSAAPPPDTNSIFSAASALMAAVTAARGKNIIIGPCTCRTCSVGCLVALLAMATGRVEQLREDITVDRYSQGMGMGKAVGRPAKDTHSHSRSPAPTVRLHEVATKLRDLVRTMAHLQLPDKECRILQASGTQFVVALPHVQVDYLHQRRRGTSVHKKVAGAPEEETKENEVLDVPHDAIPTTPPLNVRKDPRRQSEGDRRPPRIEVPEGVGTGDFLGSAWGNFSWGGGARSSSICSNSIHSNSIRSVSAQTYRASRRVNGGGMTNVNGNGSPKLVEEAVLMGALQVVLEAASLEPFQPARVDAFPGAASNIVLERSEIQLTTPSSNAIKPQEMNATLRPTSPVQFPSRAASPLPSRAPSPLSFRAASPQSVASPPLVAWPEPSPLPERSLSPTPNRSQSPTPDGPTSPFFQDTLCPYVRASSPISPQPEISNLRPISIVPFPSPSWNTTTLSPSGEPTLVLSTPPSPNLNLPLSRCASPLPTLSRTPSLLWSPSPSNPEFGTSLEKQPELTRTAALRAANKVKAVRDTQRSSDETVQLRSRLATAHAEIDILHADSFRLEATIAELRGRLAAAENMLDTYEDLTREVEDERRQLEGDKFMLELENARLEKKNAMLMARDTKGRW